MYNSIVTSNAPNMTSNECLELDDSEGPQTVDAAQAGTSIASSNVIACGEALKVGADAANAGFDLADWLNGGGINAATPANGNTNNVVLTGADIPAAMLVDGVPGTRGYLTSADIQNAVGGRVFDQANDLFDASGLGSIFDSPTYLGGANAGDDWLANWTVGLSAPLPQ